MNSTTLEEIFAFIDSSNNFNQIEIVCKDKEFIKKDSYHAADYDSFITGFFNIGYCFLKMQGLLDEKELKSIEGLLYSYKSYFYLNFKGNETIFENV